jgi:V/A-type H+-transporting ATPase subunit A
MQNAFHEVDTYTSIDKQYELLRTIMHFHSQALEAVESGAQTEDIFKLGVREEIARAKSIPEEEMEKIAKLRDKTEQQIQQLAQGSAA